MTNNKLKLLFEPLEIRGMKLRNRIVMAPMVTNYATVTGEITDRQIEYYAARARGGAGLIDLEASTVHPTGKGFRGNVALHDDRYTPGLRRLAEAIHSEGAKLSVEIYHCGKRTASAITGSQILAPSPIPRKGGEVPRELNLGEIAALVEAFGQAARRAREAGADAVNLHMAHGYLINEFLSPFSNQRSDAYGGDLAGRTRFALEIVERVRREVGKDYPIFCRISGSEFIEGGLTLDDMKEIVRILEAAGVDAIEVSAGIDETAYMTVQPMAVDRACLSDLAAGIKEAVRLPVATVGRINDPLLAESLLAEGKADLIMLGRALLADPDLPNKATAGKLDDICPCTGCNEGCADRLAQQTSISCLNNPAAGRERDFIADQVENPKRVLVAGGGPGGLEAAMIAARRGHRVTVCERGDELGGQLFLSALPPHKEEFANFTAYQVGQLKKLGVEIRTNTEVTPDLVHQIGPDVFIAATGAAPATLSLPGVGQSNVVQAWDVLLRRAEAGPNVAVVGGGEVGCETAEFLLVLGKKVTILEMLKDVATDVGPRAREMLLQRLMKAGVDILVEAKVTSIEGDQVAYERAGLPERLRGIDTVVIAIGSQSNDRLAALEGAVKEYYAIGDCVKPRKALEAVREGFELGHRI